MNSQSKNILTVKNQKQVKCRLLEKGKYIYKNYGGKKNAQFSLIKRYGVIYYFVLCFFNFVIPFCLSEIYTSKVKMYEH